MKDIKIITTTGLTTVDGSILEAGAVVKFECVFPIKFKGYIARISFFRSQESFEEGFKGVQLKDFNSEHIENLGEQLLEVDLPMIYNKVAGYINAQFNAPVCEVQITE
jgi:hypothetical protein